jgi:hypothetical protein
MGAARRRPVVAEEVAKVTAGTGWYVCDHRHYWRHRGNRLVPRYRSAPRDQQRAPGPQP